MAFCGKCGANVPDGVGFCARCGQPMAAGQPAPPAQYQAPPPPAQYQQPGAPPAQYAPQGTAPASGGTGLEENVAGALAYVLGFVTGIIFLIIDKRPSVRFNAAQSIVVFGGLTLVSIVLSVCSGGGLFNFGWGGWGYWGAGAVFAMLCGIGMLVVNLVGFILWLLLMVKAFQGQPFRVPIAASIADSLAGKQA